MSSPKLLAVLGDPHLTNSLSYTQFDDFRKEQLILYLKKFFFIIKKRKVSALVIPGDLCHRTKLDSDDVDLLHFFFDLVETSKIPTIISLGNHDLDGNDSILKFLKRKSKRFSNIFYSENISSYYVVDGIGVRVINYCSDRKFIDKALTVEATADLLVAHVAIRNTLHGTTKSIIGVNEDDIKKISKLYGLMIFGHHHKIQWVAKNGFYAGAIHQTRIDEIDTIPGGLIVDLSTLKIYRIPNKFSPRFKIIEVHKGFNKDEIKGKIVKPIVDTQTCTEKENKKFVDSIAVCDPYYLIQPRLTKAFKFEPGSIFSVRSDKRKVLSEVIDKEFKKKPKMRKKIEKHVFFIYNKILGGI